jgi:hypothetical protein
MEWPTLTNSQPGVLLIIKKARNQVPATVTATYMFNFVARFVRIVVA